MQTVLFLGLSVGSLYILQKLLDFWRAVRSIQFVILLRLWGFGNIINCCVRNYPGYRTLFSQSGLVSNMIPPMPGIAPGMNYLFLNKHQGQFSPKILVTMI